MTDVSDSWTLGFTETVALDVRDVTRATTLEWLKAAESPSGPMPPELRHICYVLARFMSGDGAEGCYPGTRLIASRIGAAHTTVARRLRMLSHLGWLVTEQRKVQGGHVGHRYFAAVPLKRYSVPITDTQAAMERPSAPISGDIGAPERSKTGNGATNTIYGAPDRVYGATTPGYGAPRGVPDSLTDSPTEKTRARESAAAPPPTREGSAALKQRPSQRARDILHLASVGYRTDEIVRLLGTRYHDMDAEQVQIIVSSKGADSGD